MIGRRRKLQEPPTAVLRSVSVPTLARCRCCSWVIVLGRATTLVLILFAASGASSEFDPYQLNGGLVSAVAGRNYVVLASDTRMIGPGGYDILERHHISSRIWSPTDALLVGQGDDSSQNSQKISDQESPAFAPDGSLVIPPSRSTTDAVHPPTGASLSLQSKRTFLTRHQPPVLIGSAGCNADCEMLKRVIRSDLRAAHYFCESQLQPSQVANLLSQILYSRRGFPYYSFCIVAGVETTNKSGADGDGSIERGGGGGHVCVYDAIGSYEQVAVATTGTGRELLQPILDQKFRSPRAGVVEDGRMQAFGRIPMAQVSCTKEEALSILVEAYRAVAEREIGVGDQVAFCVLARNGHDGTWESEVWTAPLKKH